MSEPTSPDPDPATTPGLEPGGGVSPGDTPPGESSTSEAMHQQPDTGSRGANWMAYVIIGVVVVFAALFFVGYAIGLAD
ncbi:DUF6480 family protein [Cellulomonas dongxiuzhuiae]|uniref:Uncharacterized protein n=1 Tax=Cellulomonas dongxiuzhuiae TaxID=2819979 RepID=A0ABX8GMA9_9CELL|nr:DUF6480 family protein [Cellulomonas dongxiuzhuiae]MBO3087759.1 hypothetical protein [Cellulomonas dongxiuzhuiae]MBO3095873.1 hypothetical protein [Cellulomonas dongxiuzhuiae]QWC17175.1 hypothetical protein KKR89_06140 [Cellulomonas dongxiuzhuiae]